MKAETYREHLNELQLQIEELKAQLAKETNVPTNDTVSRQAAIDAIEELDWYHQNKNKDMVSGANSSEDQPWYKADDIYKTLEALPSAQPEPHWIPCSERLPEEEQGCLVCDKGSILIDTFIGRGNPYNWRWYVRDYEAWMPLPEPYREGEQDE